MSEMKDNYIVYIETIRKQAEEIIQLKKEIEMIKKDYDDNIEQIEQDAAVYVEENNKIAKLDVTRLQAERDIYKAMYEQLLEKLDKKEE